MRRLRSGLISQTVTRQTEKKRATEGAWELHSLHWLTFKITITVITGKTHSWFILTTLHNIICSYHVIKPHETPICTYIINQENQTSSTLMFVSRSNSLPHTKNTLIFFHVSGTLLKPCMFYSVGAEPD